MQGGCREINVAKESYNISERNYEASLKLVISVKSGNLEDLSFILFGGTYWWLVVTAGPHSRCPRWQLLSSLDCLLANSHRLHGSVWLWLPNSRKWTRRSTGGADAGWALETQSILYQAVNMFNSAVKLNILTWVSMELDSLLEPASSVHLRNFSFWHFTWLLCWTC